MSQLQVRAPAESDIADAVAWYDRQADGLGAEFIRALDASFASILRAPESYPVVHGEIRRALLRRFPYAVFYLLRDDAVIVIACLHGRRHPRRWQGRGAE